MMCRKSWLSEDSVESGLASANAIKELAPRPEILLTEIVITNNARNSVTVIARK
jgi:hypothetical protein